MGDYKYTIDFAGTIPDAVVTCLAGGKGLKTDATAEFVVVDPTTLSVTLAPTALAEGAIKLSGAHMRWSNLQRRDGTVESMSGMCARQSDCTIAHAGAFTVEAAFQPTTIACDAAALEEHSLMVVLDAGSAAASAVEVVCAARGAGVELLFGARVATDSTTTVSTQWAAEMTEGVVQLDPSFARGKPLLVGVQGGATMAAVGTTLASEVAQCVAEGSCVFAWSAPWKLGVKIVGTLQTRVLQDFSGLSASKDARVQITTLSSEEFYSFGATTSCARVNGFADGRGLVAGSGASACIGTVKAPYGTHVTIKACESSVASTLMSKDTGGASCGAAAEPGVCDISGTGRVQYIRWKGDSQACQAITGDVAAIETVIASLLSAADSVDPTDPQRVNPQLVKQVNSLLSSAAAAGIGYDAVLERIIKLGYALHRSHVCGACTSGAQTSGLAQVICVACGSGAQNRGSAFTGAQRSGALRQEGGPGGASAVVVCLQRTAEEQRACWREAACEGIIDAGRPFGCSVGGEWETCPVCSAGAVAGAGAGNSESLSSYNMLLILLVVVGVVCGVRRTRQPSHVNRAGPFVYYSSQVKTVPVLVDGVNDGAEASPAPLAESAPVPNVDPSGSW